MGPRRISLALLLTATLSLPASAQYSLPRWSIDSGGGASAGPRFAVTGTIGQPDAVQLLGAARFQLSGGFWADVQDAAIFGNGFEG